MEVYPETYIVEKILAKKKINGVNKYKIKWEGWDMKDCTWEPIEHLEGCKELLEEFENSLKKKTQKPTTPESPVVSSPPYSTTSSNNIVPTMNNLSLDDIKLINQKRSRVDDEEDVSFLKEKDFEKDFKQTIDKNVNNNFAVEINSGPNKKENQEHERRSRKTEDGQGKAKNNRSSSVSLPTSTTNGNTSKLNSKNDPKKIIDFVIISKEQRKYVIEVTWKPRKDGSVPDNSKHDFYEFADNYPRMVIDFLMEHAEFTI